MSSPVNQETFNKVLGTIHTLEKRSETAVAVRVPKKGIFSFGRKKTVYEGADKKQYRAQKVAIELAVCLYLAPRLKGSEDQIKESIAMIARTAKNLRAAEYKLVEAKVVSKKITDRLTTYDKIIALGNALEKKQPEVKAP